MSKELTKEEFLKRCETAFDLGLIQDNVLTHTLNCSDAIMRYRGGKTCDHQMSYFDKFIKDEDERTNKTLANDRMAYDGIKLLSLLAHPCQKCATDKGAWHTRWGFCKHRK